MKNNILISRKINPSIDNNYIEIVKMVYIFGFSVCGKCMGIVIVVLV